MLCYLRLSDWLSDLREWLAARGTTNFAPPLPVVTPCWRLLPRCLFHEFQGKTCKRQVRGYALLRYWFHLYVCLWSDSLRFISVAFTFTFENNSFIQTVSSRLPCDQCFQSLEEGQSINFLTQEALEETLEVLKLWDFTQRVFVNGVNYAGPSLGRGRLLNNWELQGLNHDENVKLWVGCHRPFT